MCRLSREVLKSSSSQVQVTTSNLKFQTLRSELRLRVCLSVDCDDSWGICSYMLITHVMAMMETVLEQRRWYVKQLSQSGDHRAPAEDPESVLNSLTFTNEDMNVLMNAWRHYASSWMNPTQLEVYWRSRGQQQHQLGKSGFRAYLQHLSGCKFLVRRLIALPILFFQPRQPASSAAQP